MIFYLIYGLIILTFCIYPSKRIQYNLLHRLTQFLERGIQARIHQQYLRPKEPEVQPSAINVSMVTVAPILVVLAAGYVIAIFVLLIERCVRGKISKCWPRWIVRRQRQNEFKINSSLNQAYCSTHWDPVHILFHDPVQQHLLYSFRLNQNKCQKT
jgi:hypothetical protein